MLLVLVLLYKDRHKHLLLVVNKHLGNHPLNPKKLWLLVEMGTVAGQLLFICPTKVMRLLLLIILFDAFLTINLALIHLLP